MTATVSRLCPLVTLVSECWWECRALAHEEGKLTALRETRGFQARAPEQCVTLIWRRVTGYFVAYVSKG